MKRLFDGIFLVGGRIATKNLVPGKGVYGEKLILEGGIEYRVWDIFRSKLAAAIKKGLKGMPIRSGSRVLYLGAASGTTASHISDIVGREGVVFCIEFAQRPMRELIHVCEARENMIPILADANHPERYSEIENVDVIYEDVAQANQDEILIKNSQAFLKEGGYAMIAIKSQSIDVTQDPHRTYEKVKKSLLSKFTILEEIELSPYDKDHLFLLLEAKK
ncbi:MAG: fibrillarin-like rRNA/tRNA 2'-O-methyltransferase [Candidatus Anstonellales archaeon]